MKNRLLHDIPALAFAEPGIYTTLDDTEGAPYDNKARLYEKLVGSKIYNKIIWGTSPDNYTDFASESILNSMGNVLDIGCGGLVQTAKLYAKGYANYVLADNSKAMLRIGWERLVAICNKIPENITLLQADAFRLPFPDAAFDVVSSFGMIHLFDEKMQFIEEALRVLKPGGKFYFSSLTSDRFIGRIYMNLLRKHKEFGKPLASDETKALFENLELEFSSYTIGSMIFISGLKRPI